MGDDLQTKLPKIFDRDISCLDEKARKVSFLKHGMNDSESRYISLVDTKKLIDHILSNALSKYIQIINEQIKVKNTFLFL